jgi:ComF family protein
MTDSAPHALCADCQSDLPWLPTQCCPCCALPTLDGGLCGHCQASAPAFVHACAAWAYEGHLARLIVSAKFGGQWNLFPALAEHLLPRIDSRPDLIVPLPLHPLRLRERGFNQAIEIARPLALTLKLPLESSLLQRVRDTEHQARLHQRARSRNMRKAFISAARVDGATIALVDDIMTTGATLDAAAQALRQAGAKRVEVWFLARTL